MADQAVYDSGVDAFDLQASDFGSQDVIMPDISSDRSGIGVTILKFATTGLQLAWTAAWSGYLSAWISYAVMGIIIGFVSNFIFHIELSQIVDVCLSLFLFVMSMQVLQQIFGLINEFDRFGIIALVYRGTISVLWFLLPFSFIAGFMAYGWATSDPIADKSFVFNGYLNLFVGGYQTLAGWFGDFLGVISVVEGPKGEITKTINIDLVTKYLYAFSLLVTILVQARLWAANGAVNGR